MPKFCKSGMNCQYLNPLVLRVSKMSCCAQIYKKIPKSLYPNIHPGAMSTTLRLEIAYTMYSIVRCTKYVHIKSTTVYAPRRNWDSPQPPTRRLVCPLPPVSGERGTLAGEKGGWESPNSDEGHTLWYSLYVRTLWCVGWTWMQGAGPA